MNIDPRNLNGLSEVQIMQETENSKSTVERIVAVALPVVALVMILYQLICTQTIIQGPTAHKITHHRQEHTRIREI